MRSARRSASPPDDRRPRSHRGLAQAAAPESRVIYVDNDPIVLVHARALLVSAQEGATQYVAGDLREPEKILAAAATCTPGGPIREIPVPDGGVSAYGGVARKP